MKLFQISNEWSLDHLALTEAPKPIPGPGEVLLEMKAASLNYRNLLVVHRAYGAQTGSLPLIPVSAGVGIVKETGTGVSRVAVGDRVSPLFMQKWLSGPVNREKLGASLGGPMDGVMAEIPLLSRIRGFIGSETSERHRSRHTALRRANGLERFDWRRQNPAWRIGSHSGYGWGLPFCPAVRKNGWSENDLDFGK